jgi:hypothetical protein
MKQLSVETKIEEIAREAIEQWANSSDYYDQDEITEDVKYTSEKILALFSTQQAQMRDKINSAIDNVKYMKFFSSSRALEELRDDVLNILGEEEK